ncbi:hypothetical protein D6D00_03583 [Aureobasidium pullulans]|uniref:Uncharacterized protein n=1 Tax=Aureobasidium pullulans TaxID=5580 RepID=A0A4S9LJ53_AURPU|nr:hypothetical protein D6D10_00235 [Aureobasidium pullulans]THY29320.1 hypothetical protein D6D00_03583 [Aureobasidium pullulans]
MVPATIVYDQKTYDKRRRSVPVSDCRSTSDRNHKQGGLQPNASIGVPQPTARQNSSAATAQQARGEATNHAGAGS